jgi:hypothetical protein
MAVAIVLGVSFADACDQPAGADRSHGTQQAAHVQALEDRGQAVHTDGAPDEHHVPHGTHPCWHPDVAAANP